MKAFLLLTFVAILGCTGYAQKKLVSVSKSELTGIELPLNSKKDTRGISVSAAKMLLEMPITKKGTTISNPEVLILPSASSSGFTEDSLISKLAAQGWKYTKHPTDKNYAWINKSDQNIISYFSADKTETSLYFAVGQRSKEDRTEPKIASQGSNGQTSPLPPKPTPSGNDVRQAKPTGYAYNTTNFDDGWASSIKEDWVETTKGQIKILIHYPNPKTNFVSEEVKVVTSKSWDALVALRYSDIQNFELLGNNLSDQPGHYASATITDNQTGKRLFVVLFQRSKGPWLEFICPDRNSFVQAFGIDKVDYYFTDWVPLEKMAYYNRFAVSAADLPGIWKGNFAGMQQYVNIYTGANAGMNTYSSSEVFDFKTSSSYAWNLGIASGFVGNINYQGAKSAGTFTLPNPWQISFSDIEGKPRSYPVMFSCIKGARILWMGETPYGRE